MVQKKGASTNSVFLTDKMEQAISRVLLSPFTVVEAPMGYGKTTFVRKAAECMKEKVIWQKIYEHRSSDFWTGFCTAMSHIDAKCANGLKGMGFLEGNLMRRELMLLLEDLQIEQPACLIIDDYHYVKSDTSDDFLSMLITHMPDNLRLIIITRRRFAPAAELRLKGLANIVRRDELVFTENDIPGYYQLLGIRLTAEQFKQLYAYSEGWISALYLFALEYKQNGSFSFTSSVPELVYQAVYAPLEADLKDFLLAVCQFDSFNLKQAQGVWRDGNAAAMMDRLLSSHIFLTKDNQTGSISLHNIFSTCIREQFLLLPDQKQKEFWKAMGKAQYESQKYTEALECYEKAGDFAGILRVIENSEHSGNLYNEHRSLYIRCYLSCPSLEIVRFPLASLCFAMNMLVQFYEPELFKQACNNFHWAMEENIEISSDERSQLLGEYELLISFDKFNNLFAMGEQNRKAALLFRRPPRFVFMKDTFTFGSPSILYLYHREPGDLGKLVEHLNRPPRNYTKMTNGHGQGFIPLFEAEARYYTGDMVNARILAYKGMESARQAEQNDIELCGLFLLARLTLWDGQYAQIHALLQRIDELSHLGARVNGAFWLLYAADLCHIWMDSSLMNAECTADWILEHEYEKHLLYMAVSYADMVFGKMLLLQGEYARLLGLSDSILAQADVFPNLLTVIYTHIYKAIAYRKLHRDREALSSLRSAMEIAVPDDLIMPFVENERLLAPLLDQLSRNTAWDSFIHKISDTAVPYNCSIEAIQNEFTGQKKPELSPRECQIGLLALEGQTNKTIGEILHISPNTVKSELKNLFVKLGINSRVLLKKEMFEQK